MDTDKDLSALKALAEAATPGPWYVQYGDDSSHMCMTAISAVNRRARNEGQFKPDEALVAVTFHQVYPPIAAELEDCGEANSAYIAAANPAAILSLISRIEQQAARIAELEGVAHLWKRDRANPTPAVDLSGLTRYDSFETDEGDELRPDSGGRWVRLDDVQSLLSSAPVVREGKMTPDQMVSAFDAWVKERHPSFDTMDNRNVFYAGMEAREVLATGKGESDWLPIESAPKDGTAIILKRGERVTAGSWEVCENLESEYHASTGEYIGQSVQGGEAWWGSWDGGFTEEEPPTHWLPLPSASTTPSTPSQAWEGELPELPHHDRVFWQNGTNGVLELYRGDQMQDYARKAIGAAIAGVADLAVQWGNARLDDHGGNALRNFAEYIRSLSSNPVSLTEKATVPEGWKIVPLEADDDMVSAACEAANLFRVDAMRAVEAAIAAAPHPASNGNGEKGGAA